MIARREFVKSCALIAAYPYFQSIFDLPAAAFLAHSQRTLVNDIQTESNPTYVSQIVSPRSVEDVVAHLRSAKHAKKSISICGARHATGAQQFGTDTILIDSTSINRVLNFNQQEGWIEVEGGTEWPEIMTHCLEAQKDKPQQWAIIQKQGGLDRLTMGGTLSANAHGHTLTRQPIVGDVDSFKIITASEELFHCSRTENSELFRLAIGGYGLFGVIASVRLKLMPRIKLERHVEEHAIDDVAAKIEKETSEGALYGDFQYSVDPQSPDFIKRGILTFYKPASSAVPITDAGEMDDAQFSKLLTLVHTAPGDAFRAYSKAALATSGQIVWSDLHQYSAYPRFYHHQIDQLSPKYAGTDPLAEVYVPRAELSDFISAARAELLKQNAEMVYGTIRFIRKDDVSFLPWAKQDYACVIFTLHMPSGSAGHEKTIATFRNLIGLALQQKGCFYLTYQRAATRQQIETAYPQFSQFLALKKKYDPGELFQSDWYRAYKGMFS
jgi:FAD/FMN-containing dehydrogenase